MKFLIYSTAQLIIVIKYFLRILIECRCRSIFFRVFSNPFAATIPIRRYSTFHTYSRPRKHNKLLPEQRFFQFW